jgi:hypothetical protein
LTSPTTSRAVAETPNTTWKNVVSSLRSIRSSAGWMANPMPSVADPPADPPAEQDGHGHRQQRGRGEPEPPRIRIGAGLGPVQLDLRGLEVGPPIRDGADQRRGGGEPVVVGPPSADVPDGGGRLGIAGGDGGDRHLRPGWCVGGRPRPEWIASVR